MKKFQERFGFISDICLEAIQTTIYRQKSSGFIAWRFFSQNFFGSKPKALKSGQKMAGIVISFLSWAFWGVLRMLNTII